MPSSRRMALAAALNSTKGEKMLDLKFTLRVNHPPRRYPSYVAMMSSIIDAEPSNFEEANVEQVWHDAMVKYNSILKYDVSEIVRDQ
jgi:hypothetical protein